MWRPFNGPLDANSERHAIAVLKSLYGWLAAQGYLVGNPWAGVASRPPGSPRIQAGRAFTKKQWLFIREEVAALPDTGANHRLGVVLALLYVTRLRREELVRAKVDDLQWQAFDDGTGGWTLNVLGKGMKLREVPVPDPIMQMIRDYLRRRGLQDDPAHPANRGAALVGRIDDALERVPGVGAPFDLRAPITAGTLYEGLKAFFGRCADRLARSAPADADRLRQASHALAAAHPRQSCDRSRRADRRRAEQPRSRVGRNDRDLRDQREATPARGGVSADFTSGVRLSDLASLRPNCTRP